VLEIKKRKATCNFGLFEDEGACIEICTVGDEDIIVSFGRDVFDNLQLQVICWKHYCIWI